MRPPTQPDARFNVLLTEDREHAAGHWTRQLPRLLQPQGVHSYVARTGREAVDITYRFDIHAAVIDLATPRDESAEPPATSGGAGGIPGGLWLLEVLRRRPKTPPVIVVNSRAVTTREIHRFLNDALRMGAFSVINRPVQLEALLDLIARIVHREYDGTWPNSPDP